MLCIGVPCCINRYGYQEAMAKSPKDLKEPLAIRLYDTGNHSYLPFLETVNHTVAAANRPKQLRFMQWYAVVVCGMLVVCVIIRARMREYFCSNGLFQRLFVKR